MRIDFYVYGKIKKDYLKNAIDDYLLRLSKYAKVKVEYLPEARIDNPTEEKIGKALQKEAEILLKKLKDDDYVILLDCKGVELTSQKIAKKLDEISKKYSKLVVVVGSSYGLDDKLRTRSDISICLSKCTFIHHMTLLLAIEQIYRGFKINNNEIYDK